MTTSDQTREIHLVLHWATWARASLKRCSASMCTGRVNARLRGAWHSKPPSTQPLRHRHHRGQQRAQKHLGVTMGCSEFSEVPARLPGQPLCTGWAPTGMSRSESNGTESLQRLRQTRRDIYPCIAASLSGSSASARFSAAAKILGREARSFFSEQPGCLELQTRGPQRPERSFLRTCPGGVSWQALPSRLNGRLLVTEHEVLT